MTSEMTQPLKKKYYLIEFCVCVPLILLMSTIDNSRIMKWMRPHSPAWINAPVRYPDILIPGIHVWTWRLFTHSVCISSDFRKKNYLSKYFQFLGNILTPLLKFPPISPPRLSIKCIEFYRIKEFSPLLRYLASPLFFTWHFWLVPI